MVDPVTASVDRYMKQQDDIEQAMMGQCCAHRKKNGFTTEHDDDCPCECGDDCPLNP